MPLRAGDVRIVSTDGGIDLALIGDSISSGLSPATLAKVAQETDTAGVKQSGFGASIPICQSSPAARPNTTALGARPCG